MINTVELMPFKKYVQYLLKLLYTDEKRKISGTFTDNRGNIVDECFDAHVCGDAETTYKAYLSWFNYTNQDEYEPERLFVKAKWVDE